MTFYKAILNFAPFGQVVMNMKNLPDILFVDIDKLEKPKTRIIIRDQKLEVLKTFRLSFRLQGIRGMTGYYDFEDIEIQIPKGNGEKE